MPFCSKCGTLGSSGAAFCGACGAALQTDASSPSDIQRDMSDQASAQTRLVAAFVGKHYPYYQAQWALTDRRNSHVAWNWSAFLLGVFWLPFRKMYLATAIIVVGLVLLAGMAEAMHLSALVSGLPWIGSILVGWQGSYWYQLHVRRMLKQLEGIASLEQREAAARHQGGTSWLGVLLFTFLFISGAGALVYWENLSLREQGNDVAVTQSPAAQPAVQAANQPAATGAGMDDLAALTLTELRLDRKPDYSAEGTTLTGGGQSYPLQTVAIPDDAFRIIHNALPGDCLLLYSDGPLSSFNLKFVKQCD